MAKVSITVHGNAQVISAHTGQYIFPRVPVTCTQTTNRDQLGGPHLGSYCSYWPSMGVDVILTL